jgi:hypothetical protein
MKLFRWFSKKKPKARLSTHNHHHDLKLIYEQVNNDYFQGKVLLPVTWFGSRTRRPKRRFRFGSYNLQTTTVKIHRMLDDPSVPDYCVAFILYHEMLHHVLPPLKLKGGRRKIHHPAFVLREKEFREYALAQDFLKNMVKTHGRS